MAGPLAGLKVLEMAGLGPAPFCAMMLADMGADVVRIERPGMVSVTGATGPTDVLSRNRRILTLDLKDGAALESVLALVERADILIEGFRPGVMERLGLGPEPCNRRRRHALAILIPKPLPMQRVRRTTAQALSPHGAGQTRIGPTPVVERMIPRPALHRQRAVLDAVFWTEHKQPAPSQG